MPIVRSSEQKGKTLEEFYQELINGNSNTTLKEVGKIMLSFISMVNKSLINTIIYGVTSHDILLIQANDNCEDGWFIAIYGIGGKTIQIEYKMSEMKSPWKGALIKGQTNTIEEAIDYLIIAMVECEGWQENKELIELYSNLKSNTFKN